MLRYFSLLGLIILATSCANRITPSKGSGVSGDLANYSEDISHLLPKYEKQTSKVTETAEESKDENVSTLTFDDDNAKVNIILEKIVENNKSFNNGQGFRIQVFSGNSKADFDNAKSYLLRSFPQLEIYESYSTPTYRIKVGDFISFQDAEKYNLTLKQRFGTTRVVNDKINIKKALNIK